MNSIELIQGIRTNIEDFLSHRQQVEIVDNVLATTFHIWEDKIQPTSLKIYRNENIISNWTYNSINYTVLFGSGIGLIEGDTLLFDYDYYANYSDGIIKKYIQSALNKIKIWYPKRLSILNDGSNFIIIDEEASGLPEISEKLYALVEIVTSLIISPDWNAYRAMDLNISFRKDTNKYDKIQTIINRYKMELIGKMDVLKEEEE